VSELEPIDPELAALFARERAAHAGDAAIRDEMLARVERAVAIAALTGTAASGAGAPAAAAKVATVGAATKAAVAVLVVASFGGGVLVGRTTAPPAGPPPAASHTTATTTTTMETVSELPPSTPSEDASVSAPTAAPQVGSAASGRPAPPAVAGSPSAATSPLPSSDLSREQELIDVARAALARGRGKEALASVTEHARRFPGGALTEEREALAVQALALGGDMDAARQRAARFRARFPRSIFEPSVTRALEPR